MSWMIFLCCRSYVYWSYRYCILLRQRIKAINPETIFLELGKILFHPLITGFLLAAILAAIMSTISSQLLVTSSAVTEDLYRTFFKRSASDKELVFVGRMAVLVITLVGCALAFKQNDTILALVGYAWAGFGSSFGPAILLSLYWKRMTKWGALAGMISGAATVIIWTQFKFLKEFLYEMIPGFTISLLVIVIVSLLTQPSKRIEEQFENFENNLVIIYKGKLCCYDSRAFYPIFVGNKTHTSKFGNTKELVGK